MSLECTTADCQNQTHTYLCGRCVSDLQAWIDKIPVLVQALNVTIAKLDNVRPAGGGGGGGGRKPGSAEPLNLDALQLQNNLRSVWPSAKDYAMDSRAAGLAWLIQDWVTKAELLVSGPEAEVVNHASIRARVKNIAPPMTTRNLIPWLREKAGLTLTSQIIRHYAHKGYITAVERDPLPTYHPHEVLATYNQHGKTTT